MRPACLVLQNGMDGRIVSPAFKEEGGRLKDEYQFWFHPSALILHPWEEGETIGDQRAGNSTRCLAPIVPPLRHDDMWA